MIDITIVDYVALCDCLEKAACISDDVVIAIDKSKLSINSKNTMARLSVESNCVTATDACQIALADIRLFIVALSNANESIKDAFGDKITIQVNPGKLLIKTNNSKTSLHQANVDIIRSQSTPIKDLPKTLLDFTLNKTAFKKINSSLIYISNTTDARVEFGMFDDIQDKSLLGAKIFAANTPLSNYSVIDVGEINSSDTAIPYAITLDFDRINLLAKFSNNNLVKISALAKPALVITYNAVQNESVNNLSTTNITLICSIVK